MVLVQAKLYFHSPFSEKSVYNEKNRALLLSFALSELFTCANELSETWVSSLSSLKNRAYDAPLNKLQEHSTLLLLAFPLHKQSIFNFKEKLAHLIYSLTHDHLNQLFFLLEPLIKECKQDENFLFFLLTHYKEIDKFSKPRYLLNLFYEFYPENISHLHTVICDFFHKKGFTGLIPQVTILLQQLKQRESTCE